MKLFRKRSLFIFTMITLILIFEWEYVSATLVDKLSLKELVQKSDLIVEGMVSGIESQWNDEKTMIYTDVEIAVKQIEKGELDNPLLTIRLIGGRVGNIAMIALDSPVFKKNDEVFLFLKKVEPRAFQFFVGEQTVAKFVVAYTVVGWNQGYFNIVTDSQTAEKILRQNDTAAGGFVSQVSQRYDLQNLPLSKLRKIIEKVSTAK